MLRKGDFKGVSVLSLFLFLLIGSPASLANDVKPGATFGEKPTFSSEQNILYHLEDDKKSFAIAFDGFGTKVGTVGFTGAPDTKAPVSTRVYSAVVPVTGKNISASFVVNGFVVTEPGSNAVLVLSVNDKQVVTNFAPGMDNQAFTVSLKYRAKSVSDIRLSVYLLAERDSAHPDASALVAITDISSDAALAKKRAAERAKKK